MSLPAELAKRASPHGMSKTRVYKIWSSMVSRCHIPSATGYENYGGRGISVCHRWRDFAGFLADMGDPGPGKSLDRIDNDRGYEPGNCRWVDPAEQRRNQRDLTYLTINGERACLSVWTAKTGIPYDTARRRLALGWDASRAITEPVRAHKPYERKSHGTA